MLKWQDLMLGTLKNALHQEHIEDIVASEASEDVLTVHFRFLVSVLKHYQEFQQTLNHFPWKFQLLLDDDPAVVNSCLLKMQEEWTFLLTIEQEGDVHEKWPMNKLVFLRWMCYREVMTLAEESQFRMNPNLRALVAAWFPSPSSTLGCEEAFQKLRAAEGRHQNNKETCVEKLQALCIKTINQRYSKFEIEETTTSDYHGIRPGMFIKRSVFDCSRASATDTGISTFNSMVKTSTTAPNFLTRKSINIWEAVKATGGQVGNLWTAQLVRFSQAFHGGVVWCYEFGGLGIINLLIHPTLHWHIWLRVFEH